MLTIELVFNVVTSKYDEMLGKGFFHSNSTGGQWEKLCQCYWVSQTSD